MLASLRAHTPTRVALTILMAFVWVVGGFSLLIGLLYASVGMNPLPPVVRFMGDCAIGLIPLMATFSATWFVYSVAYKFVVWSASAVGDVTFSAIFNGRNCLIQVGYTSVRLISRLTERLSNLTRQGIPSHLAIGWRPGAHPSLT